MADIRTSREDENTLKLIMEKGLGVKVNDTERGISGHPKWYALRLALAYSLRINTPPDEELDRINDKGKEYELKVVTGLGKQADDHGTQQDFDDLYKALLSVYHDQDLFNDLTLYKRLLQRHIRRGFREIRRGWVESHDFHEYLYQECFSDLNNTPSTDTGLQAQLEAGLAEIGLQAEIQSSLHGPRLSRFQIHLPQLSGLDALRKGLEKLAFSMGLGDKGIFLNLSEQSKVVELDIPRNKDQWQSIDSPVFHQRMQTPEPEHILPVWPGVTVTGEPFSFDLAQTPHLLVGGTTGSGKSVCLHALLVSLLQRHSPEQLRLCLIDPKQVEFEAYRGLPQLVGGDIIQDADAAHEALNELVDEMEKRTQLLSQHGVRDLTELHAKGHSDLPYIVVFIEELADLLMQRREIEEPLQRLAQKARAMGIHMVLATQRPDAKTFSGLLRSNIPSRIALSVQKTTESKIILDDVGAERLTGAGDMWIKLNNNSRVRIHGIRFTQDDMAAACRHYQKGMH